MLPWSVETGDGHNAEGSLRGEQPYLMSTALVPSCKVLGELIEDFLDAFGLLQTVTIVRYHEQGGGMSESPARRGPNPNCLLSVYR